MNIKKISYPTPLSLINPDNDNIDVFVETDNGMVFTFVVWTPSNIYEQMNRADKDYLPPMRPAIIVRKLTDENIRAVMESYLEDDGYWFKLYYLAGDRDGVFTTENLDEIIAKNAT